MNRETRVSFLDQYERSLFKACQDLHMNITGSSDTLSFMQKVELTGFLKNKIANWEANKLFAQAYDNAVKNLIEITIDEATRWGVG